MIDVNIVRKNSDESKYKKIKDFVLVMENNIDKEIKKVSENTDRRYTDVKFPDMAKGYYKEVFEEIKNIYKDYKITFCDGERNYDLYEPLSYPSEDSIKIEW